MVRLRRAVRDDLTVRRVRRGRGFSYVGADGVPLRDPDLYARARSLGIGLLSGGYGLEELERAGAYRVYEDPADLLAHIDEVGGRR